MGRSASATPDSSRAASSAAGVSIKRSIARSGAFKKDFVDEKDNTDARIAANACQILAEEKLVKSCKASK